jgi:hypothetical protein
MMNLLLSPTTTWAVTHQPQISSNRSLISSTAKQMSSASGKSAFSSTWREWPVWSSPSQSCSTVDSISTRGKLFLFFLPFMVPLLMFDCGLWLTQPTWKHWIFLWENLRHMPPVILQVFFLFSFFLLSLFAPPNGIQQLEDTSDTQ